MCELEDDERDFDWEALKDSEDDRKLSQDIDEYGVKDIPR